MNLNVLVYSRETQVETKGVKFVDLDFLLRESNIVSLHVPLTVQTIDLVNTSFLEKMKPDALLVNATHSGLVNEKNLWHHLYQ